jgi:hypothetical protein
MYTLCLWHGLILVLVLSTGLELVQRCEAWILILQGACATFYSLNSPRLEFDTWFFFISQLK